MSATEPPPPASGAPAPVLRRLRFRAVLLGAFALLTAAMVQDYWSVPTRRDPRALLPLGFVLSGLLYVVLSIARHAVGGRLSRGSWRPLVALVAVVLGLFVLPWRVVEPVGRWRERQDTERLLRPLADAIRAERGRMGRLPTAELAGLLNRQVGVPDDRFRMHWSLTFSSAGDRFALTTWATPMDRDHDAHLLWESDGTWARWEERGSGDAESRAAALRGLPWLAGATSCECRMLTPRTLPWMCGPPCGPPIEEQEAALRGDSRP